MFARIAVMSLHSPLLRRFIFYAPTRCDDSRRFLARYPRQCTVALDAAWMCAELDLVTVTGDEKPRTTRVRVPVRNEVLQ